MSTKDFMDTEENVQQMYNPIVRYFVQYTDIETEQVKFYSGVNGMKESKWDDSFERAFLFNHLPRKYEVEELVEVTSRKIKDYNTIEIKKVSFNVNEINSVDVIL